MSSNLVKGSCHCGAVSYSARFDPSMPTIRCNCSICTKSRAWLAPLPPSDFKLLSGGEVITEYRFGERAVAHCFCSRCGVKTHGRMQAPSGEDVLVTVCVSTLDITPDEFSKIPISFVDGLNDMMEQQPKESTYL